MADYHLHCFAESGHSYKAALMLELSKANWEPVFIDFMNGAVRAPEYLETNEMAEAPVLEHKGNKLSQSGVILDYLSTSLGKFAPGSADERREVLRWILWDNHKLFSQVGLLRFLMNFLPEEKQPKEVIGFMQGRCKAAYKVLERRLEDREWVAAEHCTIADFSCCSYLYYPEPFGFDRADWPNIAAWLDRISEIDGWKHPYDLMPGRS